MKVDDYNSHSSILTRIGVLNRALGHYRDTPRITIDTATPAQRPILAELAAWETAEQYRKQLDCACYRARMLGCDHPEGAKQYPLREKKYKEYLVNLAVFGFMALCVLLVFLANAR